MDPLAATIKVRTKARELGFDCCGFAKAEPLDEEARKLEEWLRQDRHGTMQWMNRHFDKRIDPTLLVPGSKSIVSVIAGYRFRQNEVFDQRHPDTPKIAKYARGRDYHKVFKSKLKKLFTYTEELIGKINGRVFVDSAPVMDKAWARRAGLGWIGKNSNLLNKTHGSWFLIGEMIVDVPFAYDAPETDHCGTCTRCIDACPTDAIYEPFKVDSNKCISYLTIELKEKIPEKFHNQLGEWIFGCDICQDVCPWNRKSAYGHIEDLQPRDSVLDPPDRDWTSLSKEGFDKLFEGSPVRRAGYDRFKNQAEIVRKNLNG